MNETWKPVKGFEGLYSVSDMGRIRSERRWINTIKGGRYIPQKIMSPSNNGHGYMAVHLRADRGRYVRYVHRIVAEAFIDNPFNYPVVNHIDHDTTNNTPENLEWCTQKHNVNHSVELMRKPRLKPMTNTGERYICFRASRAEYRLHVPGTKEERFKSLEEAIKKRKELIGA